MREVVTVMGAGPGLGNAVARRFAAEGAAVALLARDAGRLRGLAEPLGALPVPADVADPRSLRTAKKSSPASSRDSVA